MLVLNDNLVTSSMKKLVLNDKHGKSTIKATMGHPNTGVGPRHALCPGLWHRTSVSLCTLLATCQCTVSAPVRVQCRLLSEKSQFVLQRGLPGDNPGAGISSWESSATNLRAVERSQACFYLSYHWESHNLPSFITLRQRRGACWESDLIVVQCCQICVIVGTCSDILPALGTSSDILPGLETSLTSCQLLRHR